MSAFTSGLVKRALMPIVTAGTAFAARKGEEIWREKILPALEERGGPRMAAREALERVAERIGGPASEKLNAFAEKVGSAGEETKASPSAQQDEPKADAGREQERRKREQRREQRRRTIEQTGSS
jgi:hypothetical protein